MDTVVVPSRISTAVKRTVQLLTWLVALLFFFWAFADPRFRDAEGFPAGEICLPISAGVALGVLGWGVAGPLSRFAFWFALALVGQAVALQMIDAGQFIRYQHYQPLSRLLTETYPLLLVYLALETVLVAAGIRARWGEIRGWLRGTFRVWQLAGIGLLYFPFTAALSREIPIYAAEVAFAAFVAALNLGSIVLVVWTLPEGFVASLKPRVERLLGQWEKDEDREGRSVDRAAVAVGIWVTLAAAVLAFFIYERHPHIPDEVIYLYHARYLASGVLTQPAPLVPEAFSIYMIPFRADFWYSPFPPGWPAVLALGVLAGVPWLVNPLLAGLNVLLSFVLVREIYNRHTARLCVLLLGVSPWHVFMAMNFMSHTFTLTAALCAALAVVWARRTGRASWGWLAGGAVGVVSLIRPMDGLILAGLTGLWLVGVGGQRLRVRSISAFVFGAITVGGLALPYNAALTGNPIVQPLEAYYEEYFGPRANALGFGPERGLGWALDAFPGHSPLEALLNASLNAFSINVELLGWGTGSLVLVALLLFSRTIHRSDYLMLAVIAANLGLYSLYWFSGGPDFGARYWYLTLVPLIALSARAVQFLGRTLAHKSGRASRGYARVMIGVLLLSVMALVNYFPWRAFDKYHNYLRMRPDIPYLAQQYGFGRGLVLIRGESHPDYASAWAYNPLDLNADAPVYAWDRDPEVRRDLLRAFPDRSIWIVDGPTVTGGGFGVAAGPLTQQELAALERATPLNLGSQRGY